MQAHYRQGPKRPRYSSHQGQRTPLSEPRGRNSRRSSHRSRRKPSPTGSESSNSSTSTGSKRSKRSTTTGSSGSSRPNRPQRPKKQRGKQTKESKPNGSSATDPSEASDSGSESSHHAGNTAYTIGYSYPELKKSLSRKKTKKKGGRAPRASKPEAKAVKNYSFTVNYNLETGTLFGGDSEPTKTLESTEFSHSTTYNAP
jgi:hypothetical protein